MHLVLGPRTFDVTTRAVVMGILNRTPDSFFDKGTYWDFERFLTKAEQLVEEGADLLDVGGVKAGPGDEVTEDEELERVVPAVEALHRRFDLPLSVDTWRSSVARACFEAGAVVGNDISGFADPDYLAAAAEAGAAVVATHIRLAPRMPDPEPVYDDVVQEVCDFLATRAQWAEEAGVARESIMVDAGLDLGKTEEQSLQLLRSSDRLADLGYPVFLSASNKRFLWKLLDVDVANARDGTLAAHAYGVALGCRVLRGARRTGRATDCRRGFGHPRGRLMAEPTSIHLVKGNDAVLLDDAVRSLVEELVGDEDRTLAVEELDAASYSRSDDDDPEPDMSAIVNAAQTPPFLTERRVVVARHAGLFSTADRVAALITYLDDPLPTTALVVVWERAPGQKQTPQIPAKLKKAISAAGGVEIDAAAPKPRDRSSYVAERVSGSGLRLDKQAQSLLAEHIGEDVSRLSGLLDTLASIYGEGSRLGPEEIEPYLGEESDLAPWDLTDAIDSGNIPLALDRLRRMMTAGRHPMQLMYVLHGHYANVMRLDGADVTSQSEAAELLGMRSPFPAKKALDLSRRLDTARVKEAITLLARADLDLRGAKPAEYPVMEVLVARLAHRCRAR